MSVNHDKAQVFCFRYANKKLLKQFNMHCVDIFTWTTLAHILLGTLKSKHLQHVNTVKMNTQIKYYVIVRVQSLLHAAERERN